MASCTCLVARVVAIVIVALVARNAAAGNGTSKCAGQADILLIIDSSGSIGAVDYDLMRKSVANLTTEFTIGPSATQFSVLIFSSTVESVFSFTTYKTNAELKEAILNLTYLGGSTDTRDALRTARTHSFTAANGARPNVTKIVLCITDGGSDNRQDTITEANLLKNSGVSVIAVGVGSYTDHTELTAIASSSSLVVNVTHYNVLDDVISNISNSICEEATCIGEHGCIGKANGNYRACKPECEQGFYYTCNNGFATRMQCGFGYYPSSNGSTFTARMVYVLEDNTCHLEASYCPRVHQNDSGSNDTSKCAGQADVLLIIDSSGSIGRDNYELQLKSLANLTTEFTIGPNATQFSAMIFNSTVETVFSFTAYKTNAELKEAILNISYPSGGTNTALALRTARTYSFTSGNGARPNVSKIALCITDGYSSNKNDTMTEAYLLKNSGVSVIAVGVGGNTDHNELTAIASSLVFNVTDYNLLDAIRRQLSTAICTATTNSPLTTPGPTIPTTTPPELCDKCLFEGGYGFDFDPLYCDTFYQCFPGAGRIKKKCADGTFWDGVQCNHIAKVSCSIAVCDSRNPGRSYPSGKCCNKYYLCADNGELVSTPCPSGQIYDENMRACRPGANLAVSCAETGKLLCDVDLNGPISPSTCAGYAPDLFGNPCKFQFFQRVYNTAPGTYWNQASCSLVRAEDRNMCLGDIAGRDFTGPGGPAAVCNAVFLATYNSGSNAVFSERLNRQLNVYSFLQEAVLINNGVTFTSQMRDPMLYYYFFNNRELASNIAFRIRFRLDLGFGNAQQNIEYDILSNSYCALCRETVSFTVVASSSTRHVVSATFLTNFGNTVSTSAIIEKNNPNDWLELRVIFGDSSVSGKLYAVNDFGAVSQTSDFNTVPKTPGSTIETNRCGFQLGRGSHSHLVGSVDEFAFYEYCQDITSVLQ